MNLRTLAWSLWTWGALLIGFSYVIWGWPDPAFSPGEVFAARLHLATAGLVLTALGASIGWSRER